MGDWRAEGQLLSNEVSLEVDAKTLTSTCTRTIDACLELKLSYRMRLAPSAFGCLLLPVIFEGIAARS